MDIGVLCRSQQVKTWSKSYKNVRRTRRVGLKIKIREKQSAGFLWNNFGGNYGTHLAKCH